MHFLEVVNKGNKELVQNNLNLWARKLRLQLNKCLMELILKSLSNGKTNVQHVMALVAQRQMQLVGVKNAKGVVLLLLQHKEVI